jgi:transposase
MEQGTVYVGLDYHQHSVQVCVLDAAGRVLRNRSVGNSVCEVSGVVSGLGTIGGATIEACGGAADLAERLRAEVSWPVDLAHAGYVHRMKGNPDKSDYTDARLLADLCRTGYVPKVWLAPACIRELRGLVGYRQQLVNERRAVKVRLLAVLREHRVPQPTGLRRWGKGWLTWAAAAGGAGGHGRWIIDRHLEHLTRLGVDIAAAEQRLGEATANDPVVDQLLEQPGVGPVTAWMLRAHVGWFDRFRSGKQLARYCGLSPCNASSGDKRGDAGVIRAGDRDLRAVLVEAGHRLARLDPKWKSLAEKLRKRGKPGSVVAVAIANRWMRWLYHQMKEITAVGVPQATAAA